MKMEYTLSQSLNTSLNITPRFVQAIHILQMPSVDLAAYLQEQCDENPLMEVVYDSEPDYLKRSKFRAMTDQTDDFDSTELIRGHEETLEEMVISQLRVLGLTGKRYKAAAYLAGNLNEHGYLSISLEETAAHLNVSIDLVKLALLDVQSLEPAGVGARDLQECLLIQIARTKGKNSSAYEIIQGSMHELASGKLQRIAESLRITDDEVKEALVFIRQLNPRPGLAYSQAAPKYIEPDAYIIQERDDYVVQLNEKSYPNIRVKSYNKEFTHLKSNKEAKSFLREYTDSAKWIVRSLEQRKHTLLLVIETIVKEQRGFMDNGIGSLKPMNLKAISSRIGLHESTISRAIAYKYVQTPRGVYELKSFFSNGLATSEGDTTSSVSVKALIRQIIQNEDPTKPYSDQQITDKLVSEGMQISRRTVMKYREEMQILSSRLRAIGK
jgi:RNA polymerase sigma-54 factor